MSQSVQLILSHVGTDFDGLASMVLAQKLYPGAHLVFPGRMSSGVAEFYALHRKNFPAMGIKRALEANVDRLIVVDTRSASRLGPFRAMLHQPGIELHIYDHHPPSAEAVKGDQEWVEAVGAAVTLLVERCQVAEVKLGSMEATLGMIALHEETGSFRFASTTDRDLAAASYLLSQGANLEVVGRFLKDPLSDDQRSLLEEYLAQGRLVDGPGGSVYLCAATRERSIFGLGLLASRVLEVQGVEAVAVVLEVAGKHSSIAARSNSDLIDVSRWMQLWGGGGHPRAAAASRIEQAPQQILDALDEAVSSSLDTADQLTAADLMTRDVHSFEEEVSIESAMASLVEMGHNAACIVGGKGKILGIVSRSDLARALEHELGHAPATSVMTHRVVSVGPETPLSEVRRLVVERDIGTLPVLDGEELVGIVSRTDLLREMYQAQERLNWNQRPGGGGLDLSQTPEPFRTWLKATAELARSRHLRVYAVGGFVRDRLLERHNDDLDLVVEGDAVELAEELAGELGGRLVAHPKYLTATIKFENGLKLDLATARREVYCRPAALPEVAQSNLKSDLYRRDFTINSLALRLSANLEGTVVDFFGGQKDIEGRAVRVLHNHSFFDDPTRILRAVRFEQRLGFQIEPHTRQLMEGALKAGVLDLAKPERLREELRLAFSEANPAAVIKRLSKLRILSRIHPELNFSQKVAERLSRAQEMVHQHPDLVKEDEFWQVVFEILGADLSSEQRRELWSRFGWEPLDWPFEVGEELRRFSREEMLPSEIGGCLDRLSGPALVVFTSLSSHATLQERIRLYLGELRVRPLVKGNDILSAGVPKGPEVAGWKRRALEAQRNGEFTDREGALAWLQASLIN